MEKPSQVPSPAGQRYAQSLQVSLQAGEQTLQATKKTATWIQASNSRGGVGGDQAGAAGGGGQGGKVIKSVAPSPARLLGTGRARGTAGTRAPLLAPPKAPQAQRS